MDKSTVKDDLVPTIWLFKKGGIIQKYNRTEENGEVVYESAQWVSPCVDPEVPERWDRGPNPPPINPKWLQLF